MFGKSGAILSICALALFGPGTAVQPAQASFILNVEQVGQDVVATGSGLLDFLDLTPVGFGENGTAHIESDIGTIFNGPTTATPIQVFFWDNGPNALWHRIYDNSSYLR